MAPRVSRQRRAPHTRDALRLGRAVKEFVLARLSRNAAGDDVPQSASFTRVTVSSSVPPAISA